MVDRFDIHIEVPRVEYEKLSDNLIRVAMNQMNLSERAYHHILKLAHTIADLAGEDQISPAHFSDALRYLPNYR